MKAVAIPSVVALAVIAAGGMVGSAQQQRPYDGIDAGIEAYRYHEQRRRADVNAQLSLKRLLQAYPGLPGPADGPIFYDDMPWSFYSAPGPRWMGPYRPPAIGAPWGAPPVGAWIAPYQAWAPQPLGQTHIQTGPNRWESHPIWEGEAWMGEAWEGEAPAEPPARRLPREF